MKHFHLIWRYTRNRLHNHLVQTAIILMLGALAGVGLYSGVGIANAKGAVNRAKNDTPVVDRMTTPGTSQGEAAPAAPAITPGLFDSYFRVTGFDLKPTNSSSPYNLDLGGVGCMTAALPVTAFDASLSLPAGSVIKRLDVFYRNAVPGSVQAGTAHIQGYSGIGGITPSVDVSTRPASTTGTGYFVDSSNLVSMPVDNLNYGYVIVWWPGGTDQSLCGIRVYYAGPAGFGAFLPTITK